MTDVPSGFPMAAVGDGLYVAGYAILRHADGLRKAGIRTALKLYAGLPGLPADFKVLENPVSDGEQMTLESLQQGVSFIREQVRNSQPLLLMCSSGISRSVTFALAYRVAEGNDLHAAFEAIRRVHPDAEPTPAMWQSLITHYHLAYTLQDTWAWSKAQP